MCGKSKAFEQGFRLPSKDAIDGRSCVPFRGEPVVLVDSDSSGSTSLLADLNCYHLGEDDRFLMLGILIHRTGLFFVFKSQV